MGYKKVCLNCREIFNLPSFVKTIPSNCSKCGEKLAFFDHKFRPPKKSDSNAWQVVKFLYEHGFNYQHVLKNTSIKGFNLYHRDNYAAYPTKMKDAEEFVANYKSQSKELNTIH